MHCLQMQAVGEEVQSTMKNLSKRLPWYVWLVSLPQLCSRMTHPHPETANLTSNTIARVFMEYPQQVWPLQSRSHECLRPAVCFPSAR